MTTVVVTHEPHPVDTISYGHHIEEDHWPGTAYDCPACRVQMAAEQHMDECPWGSM